MYCIHCGKQIDDKAYVCPYCGIRVSDEVRMPDEEEKPRYCTHCGQRISPQAYICVHCGARTEYSMANQTRKAAGNNVAFAIVAIVLSLISLTVGGAVAAIIGMTSAISQKDVKGIKMNAVAIAVCAIVCIVTLIVF